MEVNVLSSGSQRGNCYIVDDGESALLIECGINWHSIQVAFGFRTSRIAACLISHEHGDHCKRSALKPLLKYGTYAFTSPGTATALGIGHLPNPSRFHNWLVQGFPVHHDAAEPWGFLVTNRDQKLLYLTDSPYTDYTFQGLTHVMIEANFSQQIVDANIESGKFHPAAQKRLRRTHMSIETCRQTLMANDLSRVQGIWLLHLSDTNADADDFKRQIQEATGKAVYVA